VAKQRQVRIEQGLPQNLMEEMQDRTDEQLESETKCRSIALAILGARAAERYDAPKARTYFQRAIAASRPQERMQIRRMADASLALAERRADDLKSAVEKLGGEAPSSRALMGLRLMGLIAPPPGAGPLLKARGFAVVAGLVIAILALGLGVVELVSLPFGGIGLAPGLLLGLIVVGVALAVLAYLGKRRQAKARAAGKTAGGSRGAAPAKGGLAGKGVIAGRRGAPKGSTSTPRSPATNGSSGSSRRGGGGTAAKAPAADAKRGRRGTAANAPAADAKPGRRGTAVKAPTDDAKPARGRTARGSTAAQPTDAKPARRGTARGSTAAQPTDAKPARRGTARGSTAAQPTDAKPARGAARPPAKGSAPATGGSPAQGGPPAKDGPPAKGGRPARPKRPSR
jgi:hypothetical protein